MTREQVFCDLENKYEAWLGSLKQGGFSAANRYVTHLKAIGEAISDHTACTARWYGLVELLTGRRPEKGVYEVNGVAEFAAMYGSAVSFFTAEKSEKEQIRPLYPQCNCFDDLFAFVYQNGNATTLGDGGHTRNGFVKYCQFLCEMEAKIDFVSVALVASLGEPKQKIFYGAPGTGKSHGVDEVAARLPKQDVVRTTFHPDSDYSTFVGTYKPKMESLPRVAMDGTTIKKVAYDSGITSAEKERLKIEKKIAYEFVPQAFAKAYVQAWKKMAAPDADGKVAPVMLVVEEINRGDCAKIFGDLFQLLDRLEKDDENDPKKKAGFSEYPVLADNDFADYVRRELEAVKDAVVFADYPSVIAAENLELMLPPNMYIWATMNTSDQSLFPMDSAFKRRWDWKYVPIKNHPEENWKIVVGTDEYSWWDFLKKINKEVRQLTSSEDKQLGYFFVKTPNKIVSEDIFVNKVLFFLWNVVWKDCYTECEYLKNGDEYFTFRDFFDDEGKADAGNVNKVLAALKIEKWTAAVPTQSAVAAPDESANETSESATESETSATAE